MVLRPDENESDRPEPKWIQTISKVLPAWAAGDLREMSAAPRAIAALLVVGAIGGWWGAGKWYERQIHILEARLDGMQPSAPAPLAASLLPIRFVGFHADTSGGAVRLLVKAEVFADEVIVRRGSRMQLLESAKRGFPLDVTTGGIALGPAIDVDRSATESDWVAMGSLLGLTMAKSLDYAPPQALKRGVHTIEMNAPLRLTADQMAELRTNHGGVVAIGRWHYGATASDYIEFCRVIVSGDRTVECLEAKSFDFLK